MNTSTDTMPKKIERTARLRWIPIAKMTVSPLAQRELKPSWVDHIVANFDVQQLGMPTVNERDDAFYIIDGQHRISALEEMGWADQQIQCWTYTGLTPEQEADMFLRLNDTLAVPAFDKFRIAIEANRPEETDIDRIVRAQGLVVSRDHIEGAIHAVGTLGRLYRRAGPAVLATTLRIIRDAYGTAGLEAPVIDGLGLLCGRYNGELDEETCVEKLGSARGGVNGLTGKAEQLRRSTGNAKAHCVAAAAVELINRGRAGKKLPNWWREETRGGDKA